MALLQLKNVAVQYGEEMILHNISFDVEQGTFLTIFGPSGSGKSTLLKQLKPTFQAGTRTGTILYKGQELATLPMLQQVTNIGFIHQNPDDQLIAEDVWHELAFGLENIGVSNDEMKLRIGEMASFFGITAWFHQKVHDLSGGQRQLLNIAATLLLRPTILILDEPTAQLDPIAAKELIELLGRIHRDLGVTIIVVEHKLDDVLPHTTHFLCIDNGEVVLYQERASFFQQLPLKWRPFLPTVVQATLAIDSENTPAWNIAQAKQTVQPYLQEEIDKQPPALSEDILFSLKDVSFKYTRTAPDILKNMSFNVYKHDILSVIGSNGAGKSTLLKVISGQLCAYKGKMHYKGERLKFTKQMYRPEISYLPQDPLLLFLEPTVIRDYEQFCKRHALSKAETVARINTITTQFQLENLLHKHPEDLSGGERQKVAIAKLLLTNPTFLLLDEPTKGLDAQMKQHLINMLKQIQQEGVTILLVTHDLEFAAAVSTRCALFFDGEIVANTTPTQFFSRNHFYTTVANQLAREHQPNIILTTELLQCIEKGIQHGCTATVNSSQ